jgi:hypothetical protein
MPSKKRYFDKEKTRTIIQVYMKKIDVPPITHYPEHNIQSLHSLVDLFEYPYIVWLPETHNPLRKVYCINQNCGCVPRVKEYLCKVADDLNHRSMLLYVGYQCVGMSKRSFNTITPEYFQRNPSHSLLLPYFLSYKYALSFDVFDSLHDNIMSNGT